MPLCNPKRTSGVSETGSSVLEDVPSADWSSDSLPEDLEPSPPPKPPLPLKSILGDLGNILGISPLFKITICFRASILIELTNQGLID